MARSLGHYDDDFLTFTHVRHSSSLPNIYRQEHYIEMIDQTKHKTSGHVNEPVDTSFVVRRPSIISQELVNYASVERNNDETDDSGTLTDETGSQNGDFNFPPIEEVKTSTPACSIDGKPVQSDNSNRENNVVRPVVTKSKQVSPSKNDLGHENDQIKSDTNTVEQEHSQNFNENYGFNSINLDRASLDSVNNRYGGPESFTDSVVSNVSFPQVKHAEHSSSTLPMSGSAIDVAVILQRIVGFGKTLCQMLTPFKEDLDTDSSQPSSVRGPDFGSKVQYKYCQKLYESFLGVSI